jgi:DNA replication protein DnaC
MTEEPNGEFVEVPGMAPPAAAELGMKHFKYVGNRSVARTAKPEEPEDREWLLAQERRERQDRTRQALADKAKIAKAEKQPPNRATRRAMASIVRSKLGSEVTIARIEWIWRSRIAKGKHTAFAGEPGIGKSQLLIAIAATVSKGAAWPCNEGTAPMGSVVLLSSEDGVEDTILPRFLAAGGDPNKLHVITAAQDETNGVRTFNLQADLQALETKIKEIGDVVLVIIDPISSYMGKTDSHRNTEVRGAIEPLSEMADRLGVAILSNTHFSKAGASTKSRALHRFVGSIAFVGAPRVAFAVVEEPRGEDEAEARPARRLLLHVKNNIAPAPAGLAYTLEEAVAGYIGDPPEPLYASRIAWADEPVSKTADQALAEHEASLRGDGSSEQREAPERQEAEAFLISWLKDGPRPAKKMKRAATDAGITDKTLRNARERLCVSSELRDQEGKIKGHQWSLKTHVAAAMVNARCPPESPDARTQGHGHLDG